MKKAIIGIVLILTCLLVLVTGIFFRNRNRAGQEITMMIYTDPSATATSAVSEPTQPTQAADNGLININTATAEELTALPGIGPVLAQRIVEYREKNGNFKTLTELMKVNGIGTKRMEQLLDLITLGG